jgi:hypothetical protein
VQERHRTGRDPAGSIGSRTSRTQGREIDADSAALLHRQRRLVQRPHDEAVEQRHPARGSGAREDPSARQEAEVIERLPKAPRPQVAILRLGLGESAVFPTPPLPVKKR